MQVNDVFNIISALKGTEKTEILSLKNALNRVLACDIFATKDLPAFDNSALDGYAFNYDEKNLPLSIQGTIFAGDTSEYKLQKEHCFKIMTGAPFAKGSNSVVAIEDAVFDDLGRLLVPQNTKKDNARKLRGEELKSGDLALKKGTRLGAKEIMLLASQGINEIKVFTRPKIALICSGSEIKEPWEDANEKQIYNANASGILALLNDYECEYFGIIKDDKDEILDALKRALKYDIIITTGGASKGDADYMEENIKSLGFETLFNGINFRPAKPTKLFKNGEILAHVLPGNPLSAYSACALFTLSILRAFENDENILPNAFYAPISQDLKLNSARDNLVIGSYKNAEFCPYNNAKFSPSQIMPLVLNDAISVFEAGISEVKAKNIIKFYKIY